MKIDESFQQLAEAIYEDFEIKRKRRHVQSGSLLTRESVKPRKKGANKGGCCDK